MKKILILLITFSSINLSYSQINTDYYLKDASKSVESWLSNLNAADFSDCWKDLSVEVQSKFDSLDWVTGISNMMNSFGDFEGRTEASREFKSSFEGLSDGYYAIFSYKSNYKSTLEHTEELVLHQNNKRKWKILVYSYECRELENNFLPDKNNVSY